MAFFTSDFNQFFIELAANNNKEWFDENRARYSKNVKEPFEKFVGVLFEKMAKKDAEFSKVDPKKSIFRINRDIRFSNDKSPYKLNRTANISKYGRKDTANPGLYISLGPEKTVVAGGSYMLDKSQLNAVRNYIASYAQEFQKVINDKGFKDVFGEIRGEENKRLPNAELTKAAEKVPHLYKKQFYYWAEFSPDLVLEENLDDLIISYHEKAKPFRSFIEKALA